MRTKPTIILLLILTSLTCLAQRQADLKKFVKIPDNATIARSEIDSMSKIASTKFIGIANDIKSTTHKDIQSFFDDYKLNHENTEHNIYPKTIKKEHLTIQFINYSDNHGRVGQAADSVFNTSRLTVLIFIPAFDNLHKGQAVNTICFEMTLEIYRESNMKTDKDYKRDEKIIVLKKMDF
jgi:hypothetical protein